MLLTDKVQVDIAGTLYDAGLALERAQYDLMILDMSIPPRPKEQPVSDGGMRLMQNIKTRTTYHRPTHIIGLTAYDELITKHGSEMEEDMWFLIKYSDESDEWVCRLGARLIHIAEANLPLRDHGYDYDVAIVNALEEVELDAVLALPANWKTCVTTGDDTIYRVGEFREGKRTLRVVAAAALEMGMPAATALSMKMISRFRPRYIAMTGITAGVKGSFGDIVVASQVWDYGAGKSRRSARTASKFFPAPNYIPLDPLLKAKFAYFGLKKNVLPSIKATWDGTRIKTELKAKLGPMASGAAVVENKRLIGEIVNHNRKLAAVEMESYGVFLAAMVSPKPRPLAMAIKSICDFGDVKKDDRYQLYAAYTSSRYLHAFALSELAAD
jgi:nucleoside phosphorylase